MHIETLRRNKQHQSDRNQSFAVGQAALAAFGTSEPPGPKPEMESVTAGVPVQCGDWRVRLGSTGAITSLVRSEGVDSASTTDWASETHPIGEFVYQTFTSGNSSIHAKEIWQPLCVDLRLPAWK